MPTNMSTNMSTNININMNQSLKKITLFNGSLGGDTGNSAVASLRIREELLKQNPSLLFESIELCSMDPHAALRQAKGSDGFIWVTGTYWDSWGSPLQRFLEEATAQEGTSLWLGKPSAVLVTAHAVGAKGVLSRLQGVLNTLGCALPPMTGWVYTAAQQEALGSDLGEDFWSLADLEIVASNLLAFLERSDRYRSWTVDRSDPHRKWIRETP